MLFAGGKNAKQVQLWLGRHSASFTMATYIHLLDKDPGEALRSDSCCTHCWIHRRFRAFEVARCQPKTPP
jgi:hypothetical protein